jgi:hypothetical protein
MLRVVMYRRDRRACSVHGYVDTLKLGLRGRRKDTALATIDCLLQQELPEEDDLQIPETPPEPALCKEESRVVRLSFMVQSKVNGKSFRPGVQSSIHSQSITG